MKEIAQKPSMDGKYMLQNSDAESKGFSLLWKISLACFIVAGLTGFLYRLGMVGWLPASLGLSLDNIRHAHSHLMFFGWAVPFPLVIFLNYIVSKRGLRSSGLHFMHYSLRAALFFAVLTYPFFLLYGYRPVPIGSAFLPLSVILSGLVMICWYGFMWGYQKVRNTLSEDEALPWIDGALIMLLVCSLGAWGVAVVQALAPENHLLMKSLTHFFLATFTEGWVVVALIAILVMQLDIKSAEWLISPNISLGLIVIGAPLTFPYGISESLLTPILLAVARFGGILAGAGLLSVMYTLFRRWQQQRGLWIWIIGLLGLKAVMQLGASVTPATFWLSDHSLRILYLHLLLLGALTVAIMGWLHRQSRLADRYFNMIVGSVILVLVSLLMPTPLWPASWSGVWIFYALAAVALLPAMAIFVYWIKLKPSPKEEFYARY